MKLELAPLAWHRIGIWILRSSSGVKVTASKAPWRQYHALRLGVENRVWVKVTVTQAGRSRDGCPGKQADRGPSMAVVS
jgi:hypothetical protein